MFFSVVGIRPSLNLLIAGHLVVIAPFIFRTTLASLTQLDTALLEASAGVLILATLVLVIVMDWLTGLTKRISV